MKSFLIVCSETKIGQNSNYARCSGAVRLKGFMVLKRTSAKEYFLTIQVVTFRNRYQLLWIKVTDSSSILIMLA